jgi:nitroreductase
MFRHPRTVQVGSIRVDVPLSFPRQTVEECLKIALQAPNGSNLQTWHWLLIDGRATIAELGRLYSQGMVAEVRSWNCFARK